MFGDERQGEITQLFPLREVNRGQRQRWMGEQDLGRMGAPRGWRGWRMPRAPGPVLGALEQACQESRGEGTGCGGA